MSDTILKQILEDADMVFGPNEQGNHRRFCFEYVLGRMMLAESAVKIINEKDKTGVSRIPLFHKRETAVFEETT